MRNMKSVVLLALAGCTVEPRVEGPTDLRETEFRVYWDDPTLEERGVREVIACGDRCDQLTLTRTMHVDGDGTMVFVRDDSVTRVAAEQAVQRTDGRVTVQLPADCARRAAELRETEDGGLRGWITWDVTELRTLTVMLTAVPQ